MGWNHQPVWFIAPCTSSPLQFGGLSKCNSLQVKPLAEGLSFACVAFIPIYQAADAGQMMQLLHFGRWSIQHCALKIWRKAVPSWYAKRLMSGFHLYGLKLWRSWLAKCTRCLRCSSNTKMTQKQEMALDEDFCLPMSHENVVQYLPMTLWKGLAASSNQSPQKVWKIYP